jgi:hypothetical protein
MTYLEKNLNLLQKKDPALGAFLAETQVPEHIQLVKTTSGLPNIRFRTASGQSVFLHSADNPLLESRKWLSDSIFKNEDATILFGFGLGYLAREIISKKEPCHLLCIAERFPAVFKLALESMDFTDMLKAENVFFFIGDAIEQMVDDFKPLRLKALSGEIHKLTTPAFMALYDGYYDQMEQRLHSHISSLRIDFNHFCYFQYDLLANVIENIPCMLRATALNEFKDLLHDQPALVIAAGPSLDLELETLRAAASDYFIICADTALRPLLKNNVLPDLVATCDPTIFNAHKIADLSDEMLKPLPLLFRADASPLLVKRFTSHNLLVDADSSLSHWLVNIGRNVMAFPRYQSVAHLAFLAARFMGADPIILVGLDLSFPNEQAHASGCTSPWNLKTCQSRFQWYPGTQGGLVKTLDSFASFVHIFEQEIKKTKARCLNTSDQGALIRGTTCMPLSQALELKKPDILSKQSFHQRLQSLSENHSSALQMNYRQSFQWLLAETGSLADLCRAAAALLTRSVDFAESPESPAPILEPLLALHQKVMQHRAFLNIISDYLSRYLLSFNRIPENGVPQIDLSVSSPPLQQLELFFEELGKVLPLLQKHVRPFL